MEVQYLVREFNSNGAGIATQLKDQNVGGKTTTFGEIINNIISTVFVFGGLAFLLYFMYGALTYITSSGDDKKLEKSRKVMSSAITGFAYLALVFLILNFAEIIFGIDILSINFPSL